MKRTLFDELKEGFDLKAFETFLEEIEDAYLRVKAMAAFDEDEELVSHDEVENRLLN